MVTIPTAIIMIVLEKKQKKQKIKQKEKEKKNNKKIKRDTKQIFPGLVFDIFFFLNETDESRL